MRALGYVDLPRLGEVLAGVQPRSALIDRGGRGRPPALTDDAALTVTVNHPDQLLASLPKRRHPEARDARYELEQAGLPVLEAAGDDPEYFDFAVGIDKLGRDAAMAKLESLGAEVRLRRTRHVIRLDHMTGGTDGVNVVDGGTKVPWSAVESVSFEAPIVIPAADAFLLTEGEVPGRQTWTLLLGAVLILFALYNAWSLARWRRG